jgi:hypothetical protein
MKKLIHRMLGRDPLISELLFIYHDNEVVLRLHRKIIDENGIAYDHILSIHFKNGNFTHPQFESYINVSDVEFANISDVRQAREFLARRDSVPV